MRRFKYLDTLTIVFVTVLLVSNLVGQKICRVGHLELSGAELLFPITYIFGDIFTEVYGYAASRRAIWLGFLAMALLSVFGAIAVALPPAPDWHHQQAFAVVFGLVPRFAVASLVAYWAGEFTNSYTMAKMKLLTGGKWLWTRTLGSTLTGQAVDTTLVILIAFWGQSWATIGTVVVSSYVVKVVYEALATPLTYAVVYGLKRSEQVDAFDDHADFNPFRFGWRKAAQPEEV
ncbi:MAG: queuosine precursor transporter [Acidobacteriaceae bacterium]